MTDIVTAKISVIQKRANRIVLIFSHVLFWGILIGSIGISRVWLGGSFIVELIAVLFAGSAVVIIAKKYTGIEVQMTPDELRDWLGAGAPKNVVEWRGRGK